MTTCRCGEKLVTPAQLRRGFCSVKCQQEFTPRQPHANSVIGGSVHTPSASLTRRTPDASPRDNRE